MAYLIVGQGAKAHPLSDAGLGGFRLSRVAKDDPALAGAIQPQWELTDIYALYQTRDVAPWERRVAKEFASVFAEAVQGAVRDLSVRGVPVAVLSPTPTPTAWSTSSNAIDDLATWLASAYDTVTGNVFPEQLPETLPEGAIGATLTTDFVSPSELGEVATAARELRDCELPDDYLAMLADVGLLRIDWYGERSDAFGTFLRPSGVIDHMRRIEDENNIIPFFLGEDERGYAFDPAMDPPLVIAFRDDEVVAETQLTFAQWLDRWRSTLGIGLFESFKDEPPPPFASSGAAARLWRRTEAWVRPMYAEYGSRTAG